MPTPPKVKTSREIIERCRNHPEFAPFIHRDPPFTLYEYLKIFAFSCTLMPLRLLVGAICFVLYCLWCRLCFIGYDLDKNADRPHPKWRRWLIQWGIYICGKGCLAGVGFFPIQVRGARVRWNEPNIIIANHATFMDSVVLGSLFGATSFLAKSPLRKAPLLGFVMKTWRCIFVARERDPASKQKGCEGVSSAEAMNCVIKRQSRDPTDYESDQGFLLFPEGTTNNLHYICRFHKGAFVAGKPVRPVVLHWEHNHCFSPSWETVHPLWLAFRMATQFHNRLVVEVCDVYVPTPAEQADPQLYADHMGLFIAGKLGLPYVNKGLSEKMVLHGILGGRYTWEEGMAELEKIRVHRLAQSPIPTADAVAAAISAPPAAAPCPAIPEVRAETAVPPERAGHAAPTLSPTAAGADDARRWA